MYCTLYNCTVYTLHCTAALVFGKHKLRMKDRTLIIDAIGNFGVIILDFHI